MIREPSVYFNIQTYTRNSSLSRSSLEISSITIFVNYNRKAIRENSSETTKVRGFPPFQEYHIVSLDVALAVGDVRGLSEVPGDGFADGANVREVPVCGLVGVVDGAKGLEGNERLGVEEAGGRAGGDVVVSVEVAGVDVAKRGFGIREPGLVEHGDVLQRGVVGRVASALRLPALPVSLALGT